MSILAAALVGLFVGALARLVTPGRHPRGIIVTMVVGIAGSVLARIAERAAGFSHSGFFAGFLASVAGAVVLLLAFQAAADRRR